MIHKKTQGFTLVHLIVTISIMAIVVAVAVPSFVNLIKKAKINTDKANLGILNRVTAAYKTAEDLYHQDVFADIDTDEERLQCLMDNGYLTNDVKAQQKNASFQWNIFYQIWQLYIGESLVQLTPFGNTFEDISAGMIQSIINHYQENNAYGRTWGDFAFTDIGLEPADWENAIMHMHFRPIGEKFVVTPENGYEFKVKNDLGETMTVWFGYNLIYSVENEKWYWHEVKDENEVDIDTLEVVY